MSDLHLPSLLTQDVDQLAAAIVERHGGRGRLSVVDLEIVFSMVKTFQALRSAAPADVPRLVDSLSKLEQMLPAPPDRSPLDALNSHIAATHGAS
jgi:hypothetical protein